MKKVILTSFLSVGAIGAYAQGQLIYSDYVTGGATSSQIVEHIYSPTTANTAVVGNTTLYNGNTNPTGDIPAGTTTYPGSVLVGGFAANGPTTGFPGTAAQSIYANGANFDVQLQALASTATVAVGSLLPVTASTVGLLTSGGTSAGAGQFSFTGGNIGIPGTNPTAPTAGPTGNGGAAAVALACWYTAGGTITTLAAAQASSTGIWGESNEILISNLAEPSSETGQPFPTTVPTLAGIDSFALHANTTPEPSSIALGVMAAGAFLARRRKA
jgi:hypothetical protein